MISRCARAAARVSKVKPKIRPVINPAAHFPRLAPSLSDGTFSKHSGRARRPDRIESPWKEDFRRLHFSFVMVTGGSEKADKILSASLIRSLEVASTAN